MRPARPSRAFWILLLLAIASMLAVNLLDFPSSVPRLVRFSGGLPILDTRLFYGEREVYRLLDAFGAEGRASYLRIYCGRSICSCPCIVGLGSASRPPGSTTLKTFAPRCCSLDTRSTNRCSRC